MKKRRVGIRGWRLVQISILLQPPTSASCSSYFLEWGRKGITPGGSVPISDSPLLLVDKIDLLSDYKLNLIWEVLIRLSSFTRLPKS